MLLSAGALPQYGPGSDDDGYGDGWIDEEMFTTTTARDADASAPSNALGGGFKVGGGLRVCFRVLCAGCGFGKAQQSQRTGKKRSFGALTAES